MDIKNNTNIQPLDCSKTTKFDNTTPPDLQIFIVFHKHIFDECYINIPDDILYTYFTFIAVNKNIPKIYTPNKYKIIKEWELPIYDDTFQQRGYNENSAIYHTYINNLHKNYKYIGFFQYDMIFQDNIIDFLQKNINQTPTSFNFTQYNFGFCAYVSWNEPIKLELIIKDYETFFGKPFNRGLTYPLYNSYVIPTDKYENIMKWVTQSYDKLYPSCIEEPLPSHYRYLGYVGGIYERVMAFAIGQENMRYVNLNVFHKQELKITCY